MKVFKDLGKCTVCGNDAKWNTPHVTKDNKLLCNRCAFDSKEMVTGISQFRDENDNFVSDTHGTITKNGVTLWTKDLACWYNNGGISYPISPCEVLHINIFPEEFLDLVITKIKHGFFRCTSCKKDFPAKESGGRPLFAGKVCRDCWQKHLVHLDQQRKNGQVCRMCSQPWGNCCC